MYKSRWFAVLVVLLCVGVLAGCEMSSDISETDDPNPLDVSDGDDDFFTVNDDDDDDDDDSVVDDDDDDDDDDDFVTPNQSAKSDAFKLFYRERSMRVLQAINRFTLIGDAGFANSFDMVSISKNGNQWEVVPGPEGNNFFGYTTFVTWKLYQQFGGRELELTLIRLFEGIVFNESVSGHPGLTTREAFPGWTRVMDGVNDEVVLTKWGAPVVSPVQYAPSLEQEILDTFYDDVVFTYRENPEEWLFGLKPVQELTAFAVTYVFDELDSDPAFLRVSDCCSSFMVSQKGTWTGAYWGNHNSRDNFTDQAIGFVVALEAEGTPGLPADLAQAAQNAADAARRTGDNVVAHDNMLMTVDEWHDYDTLTVAGNKNPDGEEEWQDLGSLASCQAAYLANAVSSDGLTVPVPRLPLPGALETTYLADLFEEMGINLPLPVLHCNSIDDAFIGMGWGDILHLEILGVPWFEIAKVAAQIQPDLFPSLLGSMMDDFQELVLGAVGLAYYAQVKGDDALYTEARQTLQNLVELQKILVRLVYGMADDKNTRAQMIGAMGEDVFIAYMKNTSEMLYRAATHARMFGIEWPLSDFGGFDLGDQRLNYIEAQLSMPDSVEAPLLTDTEIFNQVEARLANREIRAPWVAQRYRDRFDDVPPVRRAGDGYECIGTDDQWKPAEVPKHTVFVNYILWYEAPLCNFSTETLDCTWAGFGCAPADFDLSGVVDAADWPAFNDAWTAWGMNASCDDSNDGCNGADLDQSGTLTSDDQAYMTAAMGCWYE